MIHHIFLLFKEDAFFQAAKAYVKRTCVQFKETGTLFHIFQAVYLLRISNSRAEFSKATSKTLIKKMNNGL